MRFEFPPAIPSTPANLWASEAYRAAYFGFNSVEDFRRYKDANGIVES